MATRRKRRTAVATTRTGETPLVEVQVVWGDIRHVPWADVLVAGHYVDVTPQFAEEALDEIVSAEGLQGPESDLRVLEAKRNQRVLHRLTVRGSLRGALGEVALFPVAAWHEKALNRRMRAAARPSARFVAIAGMGRMGTFGRYELARLAESVGSFCALLPGARRVASVVIGSGVGNISVEAAAEQLIDGFVRALGELESPDPIELSLVELNLGRVVRLQRALRSLPARIPRLKVRSTRVELPSGRIGPSDGMVLTLAGAAEELRKGGAKASTSVRHLLTSVSKAFKGRADALRAVEAGLESFPRDEEDTVLDALHRVSIEVGRHEAGVAPTRLTCLREPDDATGSTLSFAAMSQSTVVPRRSRVVNWAIIERMVARNQELGERDEPATADEMNAQSRLMERLLIPRDFRGFLTDSAAGGSLDAPVIFEVDRETATIQWEMLEGPERGRKQAEPLSVKRIFTRQLRTEHSAPPSPPRMSGPRLRVLLVVSPDHPDSGYYLPGAVAEGEAVYAMLSRFSAVEVDVLAGHTEHQLGGSLGGQTPATCGEVLNKLLLNEYDVLHYCGHADFLPKVPTRGGWFFEDGVLTASDVEQMEAVPSVIVANACLSARTARVSTCRKYRTQRDATVVPSLADEFFRRGARAYIGTAWEIDDEAAKLFANEFYGAILSEQSPPGRLVGKYSAFLGAAVKKAREKLWLKRARFGIAWAAYQHYGDPNYRLALPLELKAHT